MKAFSQDRDILIYEPYLYKSTVVFCGQIIKSGTGAALNQTQLTKVGEDFIAAGIEPGHVVHLKTDDLALNDAYEIISVDSADTLTVSIIRSDTESPAIGPGTFTSVQYSVKTFTPQAAKVFFELTRYFAIKPGMANSCFDPEDIINPEALKDPSVFGTLARVYQTLLNGTGENEYQDKMMLYKELYHHSLEYTRLLLDVNGDEIAERTACGGQFQLIRD